MTFNINTGGLTVFGGRNTVRKKDPRFGGGEWQLLEGQRKIAARCL